MALLFPLPCFGLQSFAQEEEVFVIAEVDNMSEYPGGNEALKKEIKSIVKYPQEAIEKGLSGKVYVMFRVNTEGKITQAQIARSIEPALYKEALTVINNLNKTWQPGKEKGKLVDVGLAIDFSFAENGNIDVVLAPKKKQAN